MKWTRTQFPLIDAFAMTITKAQEQTLKRSVVDFHQGNCFSHGVCYTAFSRFRKMSNIRVLNPSGSNTAVNIVDRVLLGAHNQRAPLLPDPEAIMADEAAVVESGDSEEDSLAGRSHDSFYDSDVEL